LPLFKGGLVGGYVKLDVLFAGPGALRALCRATDWSATPLGAVEDWPQSLRLAVRLCLDSGKAMAVWAGSEFTLIYNEDYAAVLGSKHPSALGRPAQEVCSEVWDTLREEFEQVAIDGKIMRHEKDFFRLQRKGRDESAYLTHSLSPIREDDGRIVGVFNVTDKRTRTVDERNQHDDFISFALATTHTGAWQLNSLDGTAQRNLEHDQIFGYEELLPHWDFETFLTHVVPEDRKTVEREIRRAHETGNLWTIECRIKRHDGSVRWILGSGRRIEGVDGEQPGMAGIVRDITDRKQTEEELRASRARQAFLVRLSDTIHPLADPLEVQAAAARLLCEHLGANRVHHAEVDPDGEHVTILQDHAVGVPAGAGRYALRDFPRLADEMQAGRTFVVEDVTSDSRLGPEEKAACLTLPVAALVVVPIRDRGRFAALLSVHRSSSHAWTRDELKLIEDTAARTGNAIQLARAEKALRSSEERYREALESMSEGYAILSPDWAYLFVNKVNAEQAHSRCENMIGRNMLEVIPGVEKSSFFEAYRRCMEERTPQRVESAFTYEDGSTAWFEAVAEPVAEGISVRVQDITARRQAEDAVREANEALQEADRRKDHFLAVLSHELRNPLAPIKNSLYILGRVPPGGDQARKALKVIERQVDQLTNLVDDLLDLTRIVRGKVQLERRPLDLNDLVRRSLEDHLGLFERCGVHTQIELAQQPVLVDADSHRLSQVIGNLLQNAAKFTPRDGSASIGVSVDPRRDQALIRVVDTGVGMAPQMLQRLFEPFAQADETLDRSKGGLGLGLALVKQLVELHGGSVEARTGGVDKGAEFLVRLPLVTAQAQMTERERPSPKAPHRRVLLIEDNVDAADSLRALLELQGHEVAVSCNGPDGLTKAHEFRPEIVLCDIGLPGMDGYAVARVLRADEALKDIHLIALSGYSLPDDQQRAAAAGFEQHLAKPLSLEMLERVMAFGTNGGSLS